MSWDKEKETIEQQEAFELYYNMERRTLKAVADKIGKTERTVSNWSKRFDWVARVKQREIEDAKALDISAFKEKTADLKTRYRLLINNLFADANKRIASGELRIKNIQDIDRLVRLDLLLMGEYTDRIENENKTDFSPADKARLDTIAKILSGKYKDKDGE